MYSSNTPAPMLRFIGAWILMLLAIGFSPLHAQVKIPDVLNRPPVEATEDLDPNEPVAGMMMQFEMDPERWMEMAFSNLGGSKATFEQSLKRRVRKVLNRVELLCGLSDSVREKVTATADLEYQRLDAKITALVSDAPRRPTQQQYQEFYQKLWAAVEPYRNVAANQGEFTLQHLWQKVLYSNLDVDQLEIVESDEKRRLEYRNQVQRLDTLLKVSRVLGLDSQQLQKLEAVANANSQGWTTLDMAWAQLQAMPANILKEYLSESQRERLKQPLEVTNDIQPVMVWELPE